VVPPVPPPGGIVNVQKKPAHVAPIDAHLQLLLTSTPPSALAHQPSLMPDAPDVFAGTHIERPELWTHTSPPQAAFGQSVSTWQGVA